MSRRVYLLGLCLALLAWAFLLADALPDLVDGRPELTRRNYHRMRRGMTLAEMTALFGPPGRSSLECIDRLKYATWHGFDAVAFVDFDASGRVEEVFAGPILHDARGPAGHLWRLATRDWPFAPEPRKR